MYFIALFKWKKYYNELYPNKYLKIHAENI